MSSELDERLAQKPQLLECLRVKADLPPEYCHYRDEGCEYAASCLNCPFQQCIYEEPGGKQHWLKVQRDRKIVRLSAREGRPVKELALLFGLSRRTVQRVLKNRSSVQLSSGKGEVDYREVRSLSVASGSVR